MAEYERARAYDKAVEDVKTANLGLSQGQRTVDAPNGPSRELTVADLIQRKLYDLETQMRHVRNLQSKLTIEFLSSPACHFRALFKD